MQWIRLSKMVPCYPLVFISYIFTVLFASIVIKLLCVLMSSSFQTSLIQLPIRPASSIGSASKPLCGGFRKGKSIVSASSASETKRTKNFGGQIQMSNSSLSLYEVLGIPASASCHEIKSAYRRLARMCHPDAVAINQKESSANEFMKIHAAYSTLSDPDKRATYDLDLFRHRKPFLSSVTMASASSSETFFSGHVGRNWETDQCW